MTSNKDIAELALEFGFAMSEMKSRLRQKIQMKINEFDPELSYELLEILGLLWRNDGVNQQEIANIVSKDKSSVTYLINNLAKRDLVHRVENQNDRRNKHIFLSKKGVEIMNTVFPWALELYKNAAGDFNENEIKNAILLVKKMTANLDD